MAFELPPPKDDGLFVDAVGNWAADKHHFLCRYIDAFTRAMKDKGWSSLHYVDLFAGPGILRLEDGSLDWGSPLLGAQSPIRFDQLHLGDIRQREFEALQQRVARYPQPTAPHLLLGDANKTVHEVVDVLPVDALSLAFLDPRGLHLHFETLGALASRRVDLIIFFPDHIDVLRNWRAYYARPNSNLTRVLGTDRWLDLVQRALPEHRASVIQQVYIEQIKTLGYRHFEDERIKRGDGRFLYKLIFCSKHAIGAKIWRGTSRTKPDGQRGLFE